MLRTKKTRTWKYEVTERGSIAVEVLEAAWKLLRTIQTEIPPAVLTFIDMRSRWRLRGYFANSTWRKRRGAAHEVAVNPELIGHPADMVATMLHEAAHAVLWESGEFGGMGSTGYYHTTKFRDQCRRFGLACVFWNTRYGWSATSWPDAGIEQRFKPVAALLRQRLPAGVGGEKPVRFRERPLPVSGHTMLVCACEVGDRTVYVKKSVLESGGVTCSFCKREFRPAK